MLTLQVQKLAVALMREADIHKQTYSCIVDLLPKSTPFVYVLDFHILPVVWLFTLRKSNMWAAWG